MSRPCDNAGGLRATRRFLDKIELLEFAALWAALLTMSALFFIGAYTVGTWIT